MPLNRVCQAVGALVDELLVLCFVGFDFETSLRDELPVVDDKFMLFVTDVAGDGGYGACSALFDAGEARLALKRSRMCWRMSAS